jgi:hypothetical protein
MSGGIGGENNFSGSKHTVHFRWVVSKANHIIPPGPEKGQTELNKTAG